VAAQIVTGIGFLGAGAIVQKSEQGYVAGLTTAASIWVTAAVGMLVGLNYYMLAIAGVSIVVLALRVLGALESYLFYDSNVEQKRILFEPNFGKTKWEIMGYLEENMLRPDEYVFFNGSQGRPYLELRYVHKNRNHRAFLAQVATLPQILEIT
jgi:putative Mg2+ transporter-C (MgtC) family protein